MSSQKDELIFLPLGGAGEIGMNLNLYGLGDPKDPTWLMVDFGITFGDGSPPGVDLITPDPTFIEKRRDRLAGLVLTHAHEDHLGAVPYLWERIRCPIYATPFTMEILKRKLSETKFDDQVELHEIALDGAFTVGPFELDLITLTHSIPEPNGIAIKTPLGTVLHTGDWKFDPDPVIGEVSDEAALKRLGDGGVLAIVCDSTNVFNPGHSGSEADLLPALTDIIGKAEGRVAVACFATNVARLETIAMAAQTCGRDVVLAGRSLQRSTTAARKCGYLQNVPAFLDEDAAGHLPNDKTLIICTGSQGESRAALARECQVPHTIVNENGGMIRLAPGDPQVIDQVPSGRLVYDGNRMIPYNGEAIRSRVQTLWNGTAVVSMVVDADGKPAADLMITTTGMLEPEDEDAVLDAVTDDIFDALERMKVRDLKSDDAISETVRIAARKSFRRLLDKKPVTDVHLIRI